MDHRTQLPVVGMIGGGQLARMTHQAAIGLGQSLKVLATSDTDPAALVTSNTEFGKHTDLDVLRKFSAGCTAVTFDHEHVPQDHIQALESEGVNVRPGSRALLYAQDKLAMRHALSGMDVAIPAFAEVATVDEALAFGAEHGWPCVLKTATGGYDGRGVWTLRGPEQAEQQVSELLQAGARLLLEERVALRRELAALVARSPFGQGAVWPVVETVQQDGICVRVEAPAVGLDPELVEQAQTMALRIADELGVVGVLAVELFEVGDAESASTLVVNELAMRPHNSGHWTIEGARTSQFEQHVRAVLDYPLGSTELAAPAVVMGNVLGAADEPAMSLDERVHHLFARFPQANLHLYGKQARPGRKVGHVTFLGEDTRVLAERASLAAEWLSSAQWTDGYEIH